MALSGFLVSWATVAAISPSAESRSIRARSVFALSSSARLWRRSFSIWLKERDHRGLAAAAQPARRHPAAGGLFHQEVRPGKRPGGAPVRTRSAARPAG